MADIKVQTTRTMSRKSDVRRKKEAVHDSKELLFKVDRIADSDKILATIGKSRTVSHSLPYGSFKISDTTSVSIQCNQDAKTMVLADEIARKFVARFLEKDMKESTIILKAAAEEERE